jgi:protein SCO1/2
MFVSRWTLRWVRGARGIVGALLYVILATQAASGAASGPDMLSGFVNDRGEPVGPKTLQKPYRLVIFGYTSCPDVCPLTLLAVHLALDKLKLNADKVDPIFVTVDPDRDTVEQLHRYVSAIDERIHGYRAGEVDLDRLTKSLHVRYWREALSETSKEYWMSHTATVFLLDGDERVLARIDHVDDPRKLSRDIAMAVNMAIIERR